MSTIDLSSLFTDTAKLSDLPIYLDKTISLAGDGNEVILTGKAPVWLYLAVAHALHGKAKKLLYRSPVTGDVVIFDHNPF
ncbi:MAG TPA: CRISPR-associated protein Csx3 [Candidatus Brocadiaceae bacterium]|nr:CRISPR-associated protein Csx3 [Candidatus Brocadiaceae bacterium]